MRRPHLSTWVAGFAVGIPAGIWDIGTFGDLTNIGTLFAFIVVSAGVIILRRTQPERPRSFRVPVGAAAPLHLDRVLPGADAQPAARNLDPILGLAGNWPWDLFPLRAQTRRPGVNRHKGRSFQGRSSTKTSSLLVSTSSRLPCESKPA